MTAISPLLTFPHISWWASVAAMDKVIFDQGEHFEKMTGRNRYRISGANNAILLSVPLINGRNQHVAMKDVQIHNESKWQVQHWRTLVSVYRRAPYFDHYEPELQQLFTTPCNRLADFNMAGIIWIQRQIGLKFKIEETTDYIKDYGTGFTDLRHKENNSLSMPRYYQVFEDRAGFVPDLSILDLLFSEGPFSADKLKI